MKIILQYYRVTHCVPEQACAQAPHMSYLGLTDFYLFVYTLALPIYNMLSKMKYRK